MARQNAGASDSSTTPYPFGPPIPGGIDYANSYNPGTSNPAAQPSTATTTATGATATSNVTATQVHQAIVAILILSAFVYLMTLVAGISPGAGKVVSTLFVGLLLMQGVTHVNPFVEWVNKHPLTPA